MTKRLTAIHSGISPRRHEFLNVERVELLEASSDDVMPARGRLQLAKERIYAGQNRRALEELTELLSSGAETSSSPEQPLRREILETRALANLRLAEEKNCLVGHHATACILPFVGAAHHSDEEGARAALRDLAELLTVDPDDLELLWLYNLTAMTLDEYPDGVPAEWRLPSEAFESSGELHRFENVAPLTGAHTIGRAGGVAMDDFNGDGLIDLIVSSWGNEDQIRFLVGSADDDRTITFSDETLASGLSGVLGGLNLLHADYDNDGDLDVLVLRGAWMAELGRFPNSLVQNRSVEIEKGMSGPLWRDVTEETGLLDFHPTQTAAWADFDNDGWLDLFVGNESNRRSPNPNKLFRNLGRGGAGDVTFDSVGRSAGVEAGGFVKGVATGDFDNDGRVDLYLSRLFEPNVLLRNESEPGTIRFVDVTDAAGVSEPTHSFPTWFFDYDNDGWLDLFVSGYPGSFLEARLVNVVEDALGLDSEIAKPRLYRNRGDGTFEDRSIALGIDHTLYSMGANYGDLDNDGWLDLYLGTGAPDLRILVPNRAYRNDLGQRFEDVTTSSGLGHLQKGHGIAFGDVDHDGDQDVYAVMGGAFSGDVFPNALFENPSEGTNWLTLRLEGTTSNRSAIGTRVAIVVEGPEGERTIHRVVSTGGSFGSSTLRVEAGLGRSTKVVRVEVRWPSGLLQEFSNVEEDRVWRLIEGEDAPAALATEPLVLGHAPDN